MSRAVLAFGSNLEPRAEYLARALEAVRAFPTTRLVSASDVEETDPVDVPGEFRHLRFLNRVAIFETGLAAEDFARRMHLVEDALGRVRTVRNGPRTVDVDLVDFDGAVSNDPALTLPHPRAMERDFVREPWKRLLRAELRRLRSAVAPEVRAAASRDICGQLADLVGDARLVCAYAALPAELDTAGFAASCRARGIGVVFPERRADGGWRVPRAGEVDFWVCPGLGFSARGERLGFGGGWYDRFLAAAKPGSRAYGVAYGFQMLPLVPQGPWDRRLDGVVVARSAGPR